MNGKKVSLRAGFASAERGEERLLTLADLDHGGRVGE